MAKSNPANLKTIAAKLGLSASAVSLALRGSEKISAATRERVVREAERQGYDRNPLIAAWMRQVRGTGERPGLPVVAYVTGYTREHHDRIAHLREMVRGVLLRAHELSLPVVRFHGAGSELSWEELTRAMESAHVSGILLAPFEHAAPVQLPWDRFSLVAISTSANGPPLHTLCDHSMEEIVAVLEQLRREGKTRIGFVNEATHTERYSHRHMAAFLCWQQRLPKARRIPVLWAHPNEPSEQPRLRAWADKHRLDAVISPRNLVNFPSHSPVECLRFGLSPDQFNFRERRGTLSPDFELGRAALETLAAQMHRHETGLPADPVEVALPVKMILHPGDRDTLRTDVRTPPPPRTSRPVTLRDIAAALSLSPATVSLALRNDPRVAADTRARVQEAARDLGHVHNPLIDAWAQHYHETHRHQGLRIAHVSGFSADEDARYPRLAALRREIGRQAASFSATVESFFIGSDADPNPKRILGIVRARGFDTVLWGPFPSGGEPPPEAACRDLVIVGIGHSSATAGLHRAVFSRYAALRGLLRHLRESGYVRPGLVGFDEDGAPDVNGWLPAFLQMQSERPRRECAPWLPLRSPAPGAVAEWAARHRPDILLTPHAGLGTAATSCPCILLEDDLKQRPAGQPALPYPATALGRTAMNLLISHCDLNIRGFPRDPVEMSCGSRLDPAALPPGGGKSGMVERS